MKNQHVFLNRVAAARSEQNIIKLAKQNHQNARRVALCVPILASLISIGLIFSNSSADTSTPVSRYNSNYAFGDVDLGIVDQDYLLSTTLHNYSLELNNCEDDGGNCLSEIPSKFSLADANSVNIGNQDTLGNCTIFATNTAVETNYTLKYGVAAPNFSERYIDYLTSNQQLGSRTISSVNSTPATSNDNAPTNRAIITALESFGTTTESVFPYTDHTASEFKEASKSIAVRVNRTVAFPDLTTSTNKAYWTNLIKRHIMKFGAVTADLPSPKGAAYNDATSSFYYNSSMGNYASFGGHTVAIIGWDDDYATTNFATAPTNPGAFIAVNSWGEDWGDNGIFYISYDSEEFMHSPYGIIDVEKDPPSTEVYSYDNYLFAGPTQKLDETSYAVKYNVNGDSQYLSRISFGLGSSNYDEVSVFVNPTSDDLSLSNLVRVETLTLDEGQNTVILKDPIALTGEKFAIVFKYHGNLDNSLVTRSLFSLSPVTYLTGSMYSAADLTSNSEWEQSDKQFPVYASTVTRHPTSLIVKQSPTNTTYPLSSTPDLSGLILTVGYSDGSSADLMYQDIRNAITISGYDANTASVQNLTVAYQGLSVRIPIAFVEQINARIEWKTVPRRTNYLIGEDLDISDGVITAIYEDGSEVDIQLTSPSITVSGYDNVTVGRKAVVIGYLGANLTFDVVVEEGTPVDNPNPTNPNTSSAPEEPAQTTETPETPKTTTTTKETPKTATIKTPDTGIETIDEVTRLEASTSNEVILPATIILIFGSLLAYDLIRRH